MKSEKKLNFEDYINFFKFLNSIILNSSFLMLNFQSGVFMKKLGLILGSGAAKGFAHIGVLKALEENNIKIDVMTGCSAGSIIAPAYILGYTPEQLLKICKELKKSDIIDISFNFLRNKALLKSEKMTKLLQKYFGNVNIEDLRIPFGCIASDLISGKIVEFTSGNLVTAVKASSSMPPVFTPLCVDGMVLVDGGLFMRTPVKLAKKLGAEVTVAIDVNADMMPCNEIKNIIDVAIRSIDIMDHATERSSPHCRPNIMIKPDLKEVSQYRIENQQFCFEQGYKATLPYIDKIKQLVVQ